MKPLLVEKEEISSQALTGLGYLLVLKISALTISRAYRHNRLFRVVDNSQAII
jgi:hypothetical protein